MQHATRMAACTPVESAAFRKQKRHPLLQADAVLVPIPDA